MCLRVADGLSLSRIIREFTTNQHYREQRSKWVQRMTSQMQSSGHSHWTLIGIDDITDPKCFNIFRNVMLAYYSIPCFRNDVDRSARWHAQQARNSHYSADRREQLSRGYILEEIALSIRIHVINEIDDEYYMRQQSPPIVNLYHGRYEFSAFDLAEMPNDGRLIRFYYLNGVIRKVGQSSCRISSMTAESAKLFPLDRRNRVWLPTSGAPQAIILSP